MSYRFNSFQVEIHIQGTTTKDIKAYDNSNVWNNFPKDKRPTIPTVIPLSASQINNVMLVCIPYKITDNWTISSQGDDIVKNTYLCGTFTYNYH